MKSNRYDEICREFNTIKVIIFFPKYIKTCWNINLPNIECYKQLLFLLVWPKDAFQIKRKILIHICFQILTIATMEFIIIQICMASAINITILWGETTECTNYAITTCWVHLLLQQNVSLPRRHGHGYDMVRRAFFDKF